MKSGFWSVALISALVLGAMPGEAAAQGVRARAHVSATVVPAGIVHDVAPTVLTTRTSEFAEYATRVTLSSNAPYSLAVELGGSVGEQVDVKVRDSNGRYRALSAGSSITVAEGAAAAGVSPHIRYRVLGTDDTSPVTLRLVLIHG